MNSYATDFRYKFTLCQVRFHNWFLEICPAIFIGLGYTETARHNMFFRPKTAIIFSASAEKSNKAGI